VFSVGSYGTGVSESIDTNADFHRITFTSGEEFTITSIRFDYEAGPAAWYEAFNTDFWSTFNNAIYWDTDHWLTDGNQIILENAGFSSTYQYAYMRVTFTGATSINLSVNGGSEDSQQYGNTEYTSGETINLSGKDIDWSYPVSIDITAFPDINITNIEIYPQHESGGGGPV
jgi:hypothetical protein